MFVLIRRLISTSLTRRLIMSPPDRWDVYSPMGSIIPGTKFIAFKVPLKEELLRKVEEKDRFSPATLMKLIDEKGHKLGGIIDLTFTFKYYNKEEFIKNSVGHKKIFTPGHAVPSESVFQEFAHAVKSFDAGDDGNIIGVHCTHGVNRTGYLICRYMIEEMDYEPDDAITLFGEARGHMLERENYLEDLRSRKKGQSSFDPNFKADAEVKPTSEHKPPNTLKMKSRWRNKKEDHPEWRRKYHHSARERVSDSDNLPLEIAVTAHQEAPHSHYRSDWNHTDTHNPYYWDRSSRPVDAPVHGRSDWYTHRSSIPDWRDKSPRYNPHVECRPDWAGQDHRSHGYRFNPYSSRRDPHSYRGRGGYGSHAAHYD